MSCAQEMRPQSRPEPRRGRQPIRSSITRAYLYVNGSIKKVESKMDALEAENNETAASSQAPVTGAQITILRGSGRNNGTGGVRNRTIALSGRLPVCSLMHQVDKLTVGLHCHS